MDYWQSPPQDAIDSPSGFLVGRLSQQHKCTPTQGEELLNLLAAPSWLLATYSRAWGGVSQVKSGPRAELAPQTNAQIDQLHEVLQEWVYEAWYLRRVSE